MSARKWLNVTCLVLDVLDDISQSFEQWELDQRRDLESTCYRGWTVAIWPHQDWCRFRNCSVAMKCYVFSFGCIWWYQPDFCPLCSLTMKICYDEIVLVDLALYQKIRVNGNGLPAGKWHGMSYLWRLELVALRNITYPNIDHCNSDVVVKV